MPLSPGTYTIYDTDSGCVLDDYGGPKWIGTWPYHGGDSQKWRVKRYPGSSGYVFQNVVTNRYLPTGVNGSYTIGVGEGDAGIFTLNHQFQDIYLIKLIETDSAHLDHPYIELQINDRRYTPVGFSQKDIDTLKGCFWRFVKISDDAGNIPNPKFNHSSAPELSAEKPGSLYTNEAHLYTDMLFNMPRTPFTRDQRIAALDWAPSSQGLGPYTDEAHLYTDMLFNMPRAPFTRVQRIAVLDWARKLSAINVPTIESFDECERLLETAAGNTNNLGRSG
ncbi:hypothetical protein RSOLAG1IB_04955 [Rhizoctonia solani AG-1 IB]|uniref:Ricin B lectin domain-containing protein n=1 Tax=Thanatephorus cucumeris (strain AG1-IB / isolate 7/3/14) TaxID=1108050 RepID=A0A0B7G0J5_THACB|nr:hypothetical protein RSOLAG1IB_04955 [Rhizoctonia solani AG-1 IB]